MRHLLHVRRVNHPGTDPALRVKRQQNLQSSVTAFLRCAAKRAREGVSPIFSTFIIRCVYVSCLSVDKDKQETKNTHVTAFICRGVGWGVEGSRLEA